MVVVVLSAVVDCDPDVTFDVVVSDSFSFADVTVICVVVVVVCPLSSVVVTVVVVVSLTACVSAWLSDVLAFEHAVSIKASSRIAIFLLIRSPPFVIPYCRQYTTLFGVFPYFSA